MAPTRNICILKQKPYSFTTNTQKAHLSIQASSLSAFVISKTNISGQKPRGRQTTITRKRFLDFSTKRMLITACSFPTIQRLHSLKFTLVNKSHSQHSVVAVRCETPFSNFVRMRTRSLVPMPNTTFIGLGTTLAHKGNQLRAQLAQSLPVVVGKVYEHHTGKALHSAANL